MHKKKEESAFLLNAVKIWYKPTDYIHPSWLAGMRGVSTLEDGNAHLFRNIYYQDICRYLNLSQHFPDHLTSLQCYKFYRLIDCITLFNNIISEMFDATNSNSERLDIDTLRFCRSLSVGFSIEERFCSYKPNKDTPSSFWSALFYRVYFEKIDPMLWARARLYFTHSDITLAQKISLPENTIQYRLLIRTMNSILMLIESNFPSQGSSLLAQNCTASNIEKNRND